MMTLINLAIFAYGYQQIREILAKSDAARDYLIKSKAWPKTEAVITGLGLNLDYLWPHGTRERENESEITPLRDDAYDSVVHQGVKIEYEYTVGGNTYSSRNLQVIPIQKLDQLFYKLKKGQVVKIRYNPELPSEAVLTKNKEEDIQEYTLILLRDLRPLAFVQIGAAFLLAMLIISN